MAHAKRVVFTFFARGKRRQTIFLFDGVQPIATAGQNFVWVGLMTHIPDNAIAWRIVDIVKCNGELDRAQSSRKVSAARRDGLNEVLP